VKRVRVPVARLALVTKENFSPTPPEHEGRTKPCRSATDDDHVEHAVDLCKEATRTGQMASEPAADPSKDQLA